MKPELKAMVEAFLGQECIITDASSYAVLAADLEEAQLAALHWRKNDLWCGPISFGFVHDNENRCGRSGWSCNPWAMDIDLDFATEDEAKAALEVDAREKITEWFKDQTE